MKVALIYTILAIIATAANLLAQAMSLSIYSGEFKVWLALFVGTGVGLLVKYWLDKRYIFAYQTQDLSHESKTFSLYTAMGIITTVIFWGTELAFATWFEHPAMLYVGGALGLAVGYVIKYQLDKRYVFIQPSQGGSA